MHRAFVAATRLAACLHFALAPLTAQTVDLIQNGSFETAAAGFEPNTTFGFPDDILVYSPDGGSSGLPPGNTSLPPWNVTPGTGWSSLYWYWGAVPNQPAKDGARFVNLASSPTQTTTSSVSQSFAVPAGNPVTVSYWIRQRAAGTQITASVTLAAGNAAGTLNRTDLATPAWTRFTFSFTPDTPTTATLSFTHSNPGPGLDNGLFLDQVAAIGTPPSHLILSSPTPRQILQRDHQDLAGIPVAGQCSGSPDEIQARAMPMTPSSSGTPTPWQTIATQPTSGSFSGTLADVSAGGWYQIEVRTLSGGFPEPPLIIEKIGVGDIYITAGQSNSANYGSPLASPADDRVVARSSPSSTSWTLAADPQPFADGGGGSVWSRLGDLLAARLDLPIGFVSVGVGSTQVADWLPGTSHYQNRLRSAVQSFPPQGFRAILWHQGESDSLASVNAATHATRLTSVIGQTRTDAGWPIPWYVAEVSFHPSSNLTQEEPVAAGQRFAIHSDPLTFLGPTTDGFHLETGKLHDGVHLGTSGLADHAAQWLEVLAGDPATTLSNGNFELNRDPAVTGLGPLADGAASLASATSLSSPRILGWRILSASGSTAANGSNGIFNPSPGSYAAAADSIAGGILPGMNGRHVATLTGGSAGNHFLHSSRSRLLPGHEISLQLAIGVRDNPTSFGGALIEILANATPVASATFSKADLDNLRGTDTAGSFTEVALNFAATQESAIAIRISKTGGSGTVLDFDHVRLTSRALSSFEIWQILHFGSTSAEDAAPGLDPDADGLQNAIECLTGTNPNTPDQYPLPTLVHNDGRDWYRVTVPLDPAISANPLTFEYSFNLLHWTAAADSPDASIQETRTPSAWTLDIAPDTHARAFFRFGTLGFP